MSEPNTYNPTKTAAKGAAAGSPAIVSALLVAWRAMAPDTVPWPAERDAEVIAATATLVAAITAGVVMLRNYLKNRDRGGAVGPSSAGALVVLVCASLCLGGCATLEAWGVDKADVKWAVETGLRFMGDFESAKDDQRAEEEDLKAKRKCLYQAALVGAASYRFGAFPEGATEAERWDVAMARAEEFALTVHGMELEAVVRDVLRGDDTPDTLSDSDILWGLIRAEVDRQVAADPPP